MQPKDFAEALNVMRELLDRATKKGAYDLDEVMAGAKALENLDKGLSELLSKSNEVSE